MPIFDTIPNSATTLSVNYRPGQNKRLLASKSEAIFTFGDFTIERDYSLDYLTADTKNLQFGGFDNLETLNATNFSSSNNISIPFVQQNELNLPKKNPKSHSYFSSFYTSVASSINNIISNYPYAIFSYNSGNINIFDYTESFNAITLERTSSFKIPISGLTNQGNIALVSANTENVYSLPYDYADFCIQISGQTDVFSIKSYSFSGTYLYFEVNEFLKNNSITTYVDSLFIRPTKERMFNYNDSITALETQMLNDGIFLIPATDTPQDDSFEQTFIWPRTIDGWAPDSYGSGFEDYKEKILTAAEKVDEEKTDIFIKTVIPENFLELDSDGQIYRTIVQTYAYEFDKLKNYIDAIAYAHSVEYNNEETVPRKFLIKLSNLLGWKLSDGFSELDMFDYLTTDLDQQSNSFSYFNVEIWRRILINIVWLYKKKGTRDAIMFIFKLLGAPDCLINFNEFVYDITKTTPFVTNKVADDGYIEFSSSLYPFQHRGEGRGNGDAYINQWKPEFNPISRVDNEKVEIGDSTGGTRNIVNTKEVQLSFTPSQAIEDDVWEYYQNVCSTWVWGNPCPLLSCTTIPYEYLTFSQDDVYPTSISSMTLTEYIDYVYTNSINPTNRKTNTQSHTTWSYPELKNIYLAYYYSTCPDSNSLTMCRLEAYLQLLEVQLGDYILQLVPATTIFDDTVPTLYKNPVFHRQRFVYREGVDLGSMFRKEFPPEVVPEPIRYSFLNTGKIFVFVGQIDMTSRSLMSSSGNLRNIPIGNIHPSARTKLHSVSSKKNEILTSNLINVGIPHYTHISTRSANIKSFNINLIVNAGGNNSVISSSIVAVSVPIGDVSETSQNLITQEIFTF